MQVYAPTNDAEEEAKDVFYEQGKNVIDKIPKHNIYWILVEITKMVKKEWWAAMDCIHRGQKMGNALLNCAQATI